MGSCEKSQRLPGVVSDVSLRPPLSSTSTHLTISREAAGPAEGFFQLKRGHAKIRPEHNSDVREGKAEASVTSTVNEFYTITLDHV